MGDNVIVERLGAIIAKREPLNLDDKNFLDAVRSLIRDLCNLAPDILVCEREADK